MENGVHKEGSLMPSRNLSIDQNRRNSNIYAVRNFPGSTSTWTESKFAIRTYRSIRQNQKIILSISTMSHDIL